MESRILEQNRLPYSYEVFPILYTLLENENLEKSGIMQLLEHSVLQLRGEGRDCRDY